jgi:hypothetical protein
MRAAVLTSKSWAWQAAVVAVSAAVAIGLVSPMQTEFLVLLAALVAAALALWLPPHAFLAASLGLLATYQLSADHPAKVGGVAVYTTDLLLLLVVFRALSARPRREVQWKIFNGAARVAVVAWMLVLVLAALRGYLAGTPIKSVVRLDEQLFYYPILAWGFIRVLRERDMAPTRVIGALVGVGLAFVAYTGLERLTDHRFENPNSASGHLGAVVTAQGVTLHRDYGFYSAYDLYGLAAVAAIAYLLFARRARGAVVTIAVVFVSASVLTLVRGIVFGLVAGGALLALLALRSGVRDQPQVPRLVVFAGFLVLGVALLASFSPGTAQGVMGRFLPGITSQSQKAVQTAQYRQQALVFGYHQANAQPIGSGFVLNTNALLANEEDGYLAHSAWATILVYTGWPGLLTFFASVFLLIRRSFQLPDAPGWLKPFFVAALALLLVEGFGSDSFVGQPWVLGEAALVIGLRFGLADIDD